MRLRIGLWLAALAAALGPVAASAQSYQCKVPRSVAVPGIAREGPTRTMPVTGYVLSLSWSPEFCRTRRDSARHARQSIRVAPPCSARAKHMGFYSAEKKNVFLKKNNVFW